MSRFKEGIAAPAFTGPLASPDDANVTRTPSVTRSFLPSSKKKVHFTMILTSVTPWLQNELKTPSKMDFSVICKLRQSSRSAFGPYFRFMGWRVVCFGISVYL